MTSKRVSEMTDGEVRDLAGAVPAPRQPELTDTQKAVIGEARQAVTAFFGTDYDLGRYLAALGEQPGEDRAAQCARALGYTAAVLRELLGAVDEITGGVR